MSKHDKSKSSGGGLLDMWFGRPNKTKAKSTTTNGGRPVSSESDTIGELQELHNEILKLTKEEVDHKFMEIIEDMNIPNHKRQPLLLKSLDEKRDLILMHTKGNEKQVYSFILTNQRSLSFMSDQNRHKFYVQRREKMHHFQLNLFL